jgi:hypothetical protein
MLKSGFPVRALVTRIVGVTADNSPTVPMIDVGVSASIFGSSDI